MTLPERPHVRLRSYLFAFAIAAVFLILAHGPLLRLPFFWDEAGQFIPASLDLYRLGAWIPVSTLPNVHPPGVMVWLAAFWHIFGYSVEATRIAMLLVAAAGALVTFLLAIELARGATGAPAFVAIVLLCFSPLFFAQSMLAQLDMPAMCLSLLALLLFLQDRFRASALACVFLVLVKETGLVAPALFGCWLLYERRWKRSAGQALWFLLPVPCLLLWLFALHQNTGHWFGNAAFTTYNLRYPLNPGRFALALFRRFYYLFIGTGHFIGTAVLIYAWKRMPLLHSRAWRIAASFVAAQILVFSLAGGAVLERYLLPALPIVYIAFAIALRAAPRIPGRLALAGLVLSLIAANFVNPLYPFPFENNLAFVSFVQLEQETGASVELSGPGTVFSAFPVSDALRNPDLGFVQTTRNVIELPDFSPGSIAMLKERDPALLVVYTRTWDPIHLLNRPAVSNFLSRRYGYVPDMSAEEIASALSMHVEQRWTRRGISIQLLARGASVSAQR